MQHTFNTPPSLPTSTAHSSILLCLFFHPPREARSIPLPNAILGGWSSRVLSHSWPVTRCKTDVSLEPASTPHWQAKKCPPHPWAWLAVLCHSCLPGCLLLGRPAWCSCHLQHPLLPVRAVFLAWQSCDQVKRITLRRENDWRWHLHSFAACV